MCGEDDVESAWHHAAHLCLWLPRHALNSTKTMATFCELAKTTVNPIHRLPTHFREACRLVH